MKRNSWLIVLVFTCVLATAATAIDEFDGNVTKLWEKSTEFTNGSRYLDVDIDDAGSVFAGGWSQATSGRDFTYHKYTLDGGAVFGQTYSSAGSQQDDIYALAVTAGGVLYCVGRFYDDLGGSEDLYVHRAEKDAPGAEAWSVLVDGGDDSGSEAARDIAIDDQGNVFVTGTLRTAATLADIYTFKLDPDNQLVWDRNFDGTASGVDNPNAIALGPDNAVWVVGQTLHEATSAATSYDFVTIRYDADGAIDWVETYDGPAGMHDSATAVAVDDDGNAFVAGRSEQPIVSAVSDTNWTVVKYDVDGEEQWVATLDVGLADTVEGIALDSGGNIYVAGRLDEETAGTGMTVIKYEDNGDSATEEWRRTIGTDKTGESAVAVAVDAYDNVYVTGFVYNQVPIKAGDTRDIVTAMYDTSGARIWTAAFGSEHGGDEPHAMAIDDHGRVAVAGFQAYPGSSQMTVLYYSGGCGIDDEAYANNEPNPGNACQACSVDQDNEDWSNADDGAGCDDGLYCNGADTCAGGECVHAGDPCGADESCNEDTDSCDPLGGDDDDDNDDSDDGDGDDDDDGCGC